jgi:sugar-specific transcriptional regulator TrmB
MNSAPSRKAEDMEERTEIIYGFENIIKITLDRFSLTKHTIDSCIDKSNPETIMTVKPIVKAISDNSLRGIKSRVITEITRDNILYCKQLMKIITELRHLDEVTGNFSISDRSIYQATVLGDFSRRYVSESASGSNGIDMIELDPATETIQSTMRAFVTQQQYFFDMLWKKAIPAKQRIKEIEEHQKREFIETIQDPSETLDLIHETISSATEEIMIMFPTIRSFQVYEREGILNLIKRQLENRVNVRLLLSEKDRTPQGGWRGISSFPNLQIQYTDQLPSSRLTMLIVDNELSLVIEEKKSEDPVGIATYSNSESTVLSYASIFENLWIQSEIKQR